LPVIQLRRIDHAGLRVADLDEAVERWSIQFGLTVRERAGDRAFLHCGYEDYSLELELGVPGFDHHAFELARDCSLEEAEAHLAELQVAFERRGDALHLADADGFGVELVPYRPGSVRPDVARSTVDLPGYRPRKLGHTNFLTGDLDAQTAFYTDVLGMRLTDRLGDEGAWLHCNADHHVLALVGKGTPHIHHIALELVDWGELRVALDHLAQHGRWLAWGPLRHGLGRNLSAYVRIPEEELFVELYCDMEQLEPDHVARDWPDDRHSSNTWGPLPPRSYFRFDAEAVRYERESLEMLGEKLPPLEVTD
jgi:catechol-2,3-dioxygenase